MKLEIFEFSKNTLNGTRFLYALELNRSITFFMNSQISQDLDSILDKFKCHLRNHNTDFNLELRPLGQISGMKYKVIFDQEVSDTYLKDL